MLFEESNIFFNVEAQTKLDVLNLIAKEAKVLNICDDANGLLKDLLSREEEFSTGLQDGFAIPHARSIHVKTPSILYLKMNEKLEWGTMDDKQVECIFSLLVPAANEGNQHLQMLSQLATCLLEDDFKKYVKSSTDKQELKKYINKMMEVK